MEEPFPAGDLGGPRLIDVALAVPEIAPHAFGTTVAVLIGALGLLERRLRRFGLPALTAR